MVEERGGDVCCRGNSVTGERIVHTENTADALRSYSLWKIRTYISDKLSILKPDECLFDFLPQVYS